MNQIFLGALIATFWSAMCVVLGMMWERWTWLDVSSTNGVWQWNKIHIRLTRLDPAAKGSEG